MKFATFIGITLGVGMLVGWFGPGAPDVSPTPSSSGEPSPAQLAVMQRDQWLAGETVLPRADDGHFYADVTVDGASTQMLVDTGATTVALTTEDADRIGEKVSPASFDVVGEGAGGAVRGERLMIESIEIEGKRVENVRGVVLEGLGQSLLGQNYLSRMGSVEMTADEMVIRPRTRTAG